MEVFDDWQLMGEKNCALALNDFEKTAKSHIFSTKTQDFLPSILENISHLKSLLFVLKNHNKNEDAIFVLDSIGRELEKQTFALKQIFDLGARILEAPKVETKIFCNNLKLSVQICLETTNMLSKQSQNVSFEQKSALEKVVESFFEICQKYVSLFGDCQYRVFLNKYKNV